ncbi:hypothetical protein ACFL6C_11545 [Myxococcota bacterium]
MRAKCLFVCVCVGAVGMMACGDDDDDDTRVASLVDIMEEGIHHYRTFPAFRVAANITPQIPATVFGLCKYAGIKRTGDWSLDQEMQCYVFNTTDGYTRGQHLSTATLKGDFEKIDGFDPMERVRWTFTVESDNTGVFSAGAQVDWIVTGSEGSQDGDGPQYILKWTGYDTLDENRPTTAYFEGGKIFYFARCLGKETLSDAQNNFCNVGCQHPMPDIAQQMAAPYEPDNFPICTKAIVDTLQ